MIHQEKRELHLILTYFSKARTHYQSLLDHPEKVNNYLKEGQLKARQIAQQNLFKIKEGIGI